VLADYYKLLCWSAESDPEGAMVLLRSKHELAFGVSPERMDVAVDSVIRHVSPSHPLFGWALFWKAHCAVEVDVQSALPIVFNAVHRGIQQHDLDLQVSSSYLLGAIQITLGDLPKAKDTANTCLTIAHRARNPLLRSRALSLQGTLAMHSGMPWKGLGLMEEAAAGFRSNLLEYACHLGLTALYLASDGHRIKAERLLDEVEPLAASTQHHWLEQVSVMTRELLANDVRRYDARAHTINPRVPGDHAETPLEPGDKTHISDRVRRSRRFRYREKMVPTSLDHMRREDPKH
jgi:hypothetical protein